MNFYPKGYFKRVPEISTEYLKENNIKGLILDVDNTLIDYYKNMSEDTMKWANELKQNGIKMCILSNSNKKEKVKEVASKLGLEYSYFGMKPFKRGFKKAKQMLNLENSEIAVIGDQIFTDVIGANRMKMHSILVEPIEEKDIFITLIKRPIENYIKNRYLEKKENVKKNYFKSNMREDLTREISMNYNKKVETKSNSNIKNKGYNRGEK